MPFMRQSQPDQIHILWDASQIWGLMAWRALRATGLPCRLVKAKEIAEGRILGKGHDLLIVPGGNARKKALALSASGREAIRAHLRNGGSYLGFCGGAGLALSHPSEEDGLGLCPWGRGSYPQRLQHMISGHLHASISQQSHYLPPWHGQDKGMENDHRQDGRGQKDRQKKTGLTGQAGLAHVLLPVWWPGRFEPGPDDSVQVIAQCRAPAADLWLADLPFSSLPEHILENWKKLYGIDASLDFLDGQPLAICGQYGNGRYVLSYSHLETPASPDANQILLAILEDLAGCRIGQEVRQTAIPAWDLDLPGRDGPTDKHGPEGDLGLIVNQALTRTRELLDLGVELHLFFRRTSWLWGWQAGLPGAALNSLHAALCTIAELPVTDRAIAYWQARAGEFARLCNDLAEGARGYLLASRLGETLAGFHPDAIKRQELEKQRQALFGHPMHGGGMIARLLDIAGELCFLLQPGD